MLQGNRDDGYKRNEDKAWRERVDERLASLTAGENVQDGRLDFLQEEIQKHRHLLYGNDDDREDHGFKGEVEELNRRTSELRSLIAPIVDKETTIQSRLKFWGPIIVAVISSMAFIIKEWGPDIAERWNHNIQELTAPRNLGKHVKHKKKRVEVEEEKPEQEPNEE